ncbi:hypothetical protein GF391_01970 [Candidatus Uhrbacteria bacterium]|nr:hypothetical protein [Candidatus Uhrbacteria bacterium]
MHEKPNHSSPVHTISERPTVTKRARNVNHKYEVGFGTRESSTRVHRINRRRTKQKCHDLVRGIDYHDMVFGPNKGKHMFTERDVV